MRGRGRELLEKTGHRKDVKGYWTHCHLQRRALRLRHVKRFSGGDTARHERCQPVSTLEVGDRPCCTSTPPWPAPLPSTRLSTVVDVSAHLCWEPGGGNNPKREAGEKMGSLGWNWHAQSHADNLREFESPAGCLSPCPVASSYVWLPLSVSSGAAWKPLDFEKWCLLLSHLGLDPVRTIAVHVRSPGSQALAFNLVSALDSHCSDSHSALSRVYSVSGRDSKAPCRESFGGATGIVVAGSSL